MEVLNWRVLEVKNGQVRLISEKATNSIIYLEGKMDIIML